MNAVGFTNIGSVCYANCVFECILHLPPLVQYVITIHWLVLNIPSIRWLSRLPDAPLELPYTRELQSLVTTALVSTSSKVPVLHSIDMLSHTISAFCPTVSHPPPVAVPGISFHQPTTRHQDIFEFLTYLLNALHSELSTDAPELQLDVWNEVVSKYKLNIDAKSKNRVFCELAKSPISKLFFIAHRLVKYAKIFLLVLTCLISDLKWLTTQKELSMHHTNLAIAYR